MVDEGGRRQGPTGKPGWQERAAKIGMQPTASYLLPFGKHKGSPVSTLPDDYLQWLSTRELRDPLRSVVARELRTRGQQLAIQDMSVRLNEARAQGFFIVQEGHEVEVRDYQASCVAAHKPSVCVALGQKTATVAISYVGITAPLTHLLQLQHTLAQQWPLYSPHYLPPASIILVGVPRALVATMMPELVGLLDTVAPQQSEVL